MPQIKIENQNLLVGISVFAFFMAITLFINATITLFIVVTIGLIALFKVFLKAWFGIDVIKAEKTEEEKKEEYRRRGW